MSEGHGGIEDIIEKIDHKYLRKERLNLNKRFYDALQFDEVKKLLHDEPGEEHGDHPMEDIYAGLGRMYAHMKGYDLADENKEYAMTHASAEVKQLLNQIFRDGGRQRGYDDEWAGLRYVIDEIRKGNAWEVFIRLSSVIRNQYMDQINKKHLSKITEGDVEMDYTHQKKLAEQYVEKFGGELVDIQPNIVDRIYEKADHQKYHPKPKGDHGHH